MEGPKVPLAWQLWTVFCALLGIAVLIVLGIVAFELIAYLRAHR